MRLGSTTPGETPGAGCVKRPHNSRLKGVSRPFTVSAVTEWMSVVVTQCEDEFQDSGLLWWGTCSPPPSEQHITHVGISMEGCGLRRSQSVGPFT